ncbi:unnamed protein product [Protopolystoma xenopodis]|uniref:Uncharacterized protein n=1 Tax=Protopolystoma xenopodis TaxID=117903 RepID=A0A3S5BMM8_9PLAT|nr:unnamed protein product [Protopolystoma xenopodis]
MYSCLASTTSGPSTYFSSQWSQLGSRPMSSEARLLIHAHRHLYLVASGASASLLLPHDVSEGVISPPSEIDSPGANRDVDQLFSIDKSSVGIVAGPSLLAHTCQPLLAPFDFALSFTRVFCPELWPKSLSASLALQEWRLLVRDELSITMTHASLQLTILLVTAAVHRISRLTLMSFYSGLYTCNEESRGAVGKQQLGCISRIGCKRPAGATDPRTGNRQQQHLSYDCRVLLPPSACFGHKTYCYFSLHSSPLWSSAAEGMFLYYLVKQITLIVH